VDALVVAALMVDRIRIIPHAPEGIPDCGSFEVWFADGRPSQYFYWDDNRGRTSITRKMDRDEAREAARALARSERAKPENICSLCDGGGWVCEEHPDQPWQHACTCGAAGAPCPHCNSAADEPLRLPKGFEPDAD
jgi:hypothetical protein